MNVLIKYQTFFMSQFHTETRSQENLPLCELFILGNDSTHVFGLQTCEQNIDIYLK